jgi:hypothetical protein
MSIAVVSSCLALVWFGVCVFGGGGMSLAVVSSCHDIMRS